MLIRNWKIYDTALYIRSVGLYFDVSSTKWLQQREWLPWLVYMIMLGKLSLKGKLDIGKAFLLSTATLILDILLKVSA